MVGVTTGHIADLTTHCHNIRCNCNYCNIASTMILNYFQPATTALEETTPPPKRKKSPVQPSTAPIEPSSSPLRTPRTENLASPLFVPSSPSQTASVAARTPSPAPLSSTAMEVEPQGAYSIDCNCVICLQDLLQEATTIAASSSASQPEPRRPLPKFRLSNNSTSYAAVAAMAAKPGMKLSDRPNRKGDLIIIPKDLDTARNLQEEQDLTLLDPALIKRKAIISRYPTSLPISIVTSCSNVEKADRCKNRDNVPVRRLLATFIGPVPSSLDLGVWGTYPIQEYTPEPLRCYHCQRYGHHKEDCQGPAFCGVCSQRHNTEICIQAHKNGQETHPKCRNYSRPHHAWNKRCPESLRRIAAMKGTNPP
ncbi:uncharacterized protein [Palaemon carinicauda]|uniref:uncharacterized protein n=1 Tax=Palaemon carinicauda TaxID=392227 RepID=UPI0035B616E7